VNADAYREALENSYELARAGKHVEAYRFVTDLLDKGFLSSDLLVLRSQLIQLMNDEECGRFKDANLETAEDGLRAACALSPDSARPLLELAYYEYAVMERSDDALSHFQHASEILEQDLRECLVGRARTYFDLGRADDGWEEIARLRAYFPDFDATEVLDQAVDGQEEDD
jgi:tetratricopeptide (TPR) repeat protein